MAKELIEAAVEVGQDIAIFFADVGEGLYDVGKAIYCAFADCSSSPPPPQPPQQAIYDGCFAPQLNAGLTALETKGESGLAGLIQNLTSPQGMKSCYQNVSAALLKSKYSTPNSLQNDTSTFLYQVSGQFSKQVHANRDADIPKTVIPQLLAKRASMQDQDMFNMLLTGAGKMASNWSGSYYTTGLDVNNLALKDFSRYSAMIQDECNIVFSPFAQVDDWIKNYPDDAKKIAEYGQPGLMTNAQWCALQVNQDQMKYKAFANGLKPSNCPPSGNMGSASYKYRCASLTDYGVCRIVKSLWPPDQDQCGFNVPVVGQQVASNSTVMNCIVTVLDNSPTTDTPVQMGCSRPAMTTCAQEKYDTHYKLPVTLVNFKTTPDAQYAALVARVNAIVWLVSHSQDPHGSLSCPPACSITPAKTRTISASDVNISKDRFATVGQNQAAVKPANEKTATVNANSANKLANVSNDSVTGKVQAPNTSRTGVATEMTQPKLCGNRIQVSDLDPLIVYAEECVVNLLRGDPNQDFGFKGKDQKPVKWFYAEPGFNNITVVKTDYHPTDCSSVDTPILVDLWQSKYTLPPH